MEKALLNFMDDRATTTTIETNQGYSSLLSDRAAFDNIYASSLPLRDIIHTPGQHVMNYYGLSVTFPSLPKEARLAREMIWGLIGIYDENQHIVSLVDFGNEITKAVREKRPSVDVVTMVDMITVHANSQEQAKLTDIFYRKGVEIDQTGFGDIVTFLNQYDEFATTLAQRYLGVASYKALDFKPTYASWKYAHYLDTSKKTQVIKSKYYRLLEAKRTFAGPALFVTSSGNFSFDEMDTLVQECHDFMFDNDQSSLGKRGMIRDLYRKIFDKYFKITENKWAAFSFTDTDADVILQRYQELGNEEVNLLMRAFQFAHNELYLVRNNLQKFLARYKFFDTIIDDFSKAFTPNFTSENLKIPPDVFDEIVSATSINGKTAFRKLVHFLLQASGGLDRTPQGYNEEKQQFFKRFLDALHTGKITPESSTGDTPIERERFKNAIDFVINAKKMDTENVSVLELGVGTGRILNWLKDKFPKMKALGIDIVEEKKLREYGLSDKILFNKVDVVDLTPEVLKRLFNVDKVDIIIAPWSLFGDLSNKELEQVLSVIKKIARVVISDNPLLTVQNTFYMDQMRSGSQPHQVPLNFNVDDHNLTKWIWGRPPENLIQLHEQQGIRIMNIPPDTASREQFFADLRTQPLVRTPDIHIPQWKTAIGKPRFTLVGDCEEAHVNV